MHLRDVRQLGHTLWSHILHELVNRLERRVGVPGRCFHADLRWRRRAHALLALRHELADRLRSARPRKSPPPLSLTNARVHACLLLRRARKRWHWAYRWLWEGNQYLVRVAHRPLWPDRAGFWDRVTYLV